MFALQISVLVVIAILFYLGSSCVCRGLRIINLDAPSTATQGDTIQLSCLYILSDDDAEPTKSSLLAGSSGRSTGVESPTVTQTASKPLETLYAVKWYKDGREFFRFVAHEWPKRLSLPVDGIHVDLDKSDNQSVVLKQVGLRSSGLFKCEVSTDAPFFVTKSIERKMLVYHPRGIQAKTLTASLDLPSSNPVIEIVKPSMAQKWAHKTHEFYLGDQIELVCSAPESKPVAQIDWIVDSSINLTATWELPIKLATIFQTRAQRFVRLAKSLNQLDPNIKSNRMQQSKLNNETVYEIINATLVSVDDKQPSSSLQLPLDFALFDQLAESSSSRLSFSVDGEFLQALNDLKSNGSSQSRFARQVESISRHKRVHSQLDPSASKRGSLQPDLGSYRPKAASFKSLASLQTTESISQMNTPDANPIGKARGFHKSSSSMISSDKSKLTLALKCVSRILHLKMASSIRLTIFNKTRPRAEAQKASKRIGNLGQKNSASTIGSQKLLNTLIHTCAICLALPLQFFTTNRIRTSQSIV